MADSVESKARSEKSLRLLAIKFVSLLRSSRGGILDIQTATEKLKLPRPRRLYDVTCVLEAVGLIEKIGSSCIKWVGCELEGDNLISKIASLKFDNLLLDQEESHLDELLKVVQNRFNEDIKEANENKLAFVEFDDVSKCFNDCEALIAIEVPNGTKVRFEQGSSEEASHNDDLKLEEGPAENLIFRENGANIQNSENQKDTMLSANDELVKDCKVNLDKDKTNSVDKSDLPVDETQLNDSSSLSCLENGLKFVNYELTYEGDDIYVMTSSEPSNI